METKRCSRCGQVKPVSEFTKKASNKDGLDSQCKDCKRVGQYAWRHGTTEGFEADKRHGSKYTDEQIAEWKAYVLEHGSIREAAVHFDVISNTMQKYVRDELQAYKAKRNTKIIELRNTGHTANEIAEILGINKGVVEIVCRANGLGGQIRCSSGFKSEAAVKARKEREKTQRAAGEGKCRENAIRYGFEYIGGYTGSDGTVTLRCKDCGRAFELSCITLRHKNTQSVNCPLCAEDRRLEVEKQKLDEAEANRIERMFESYIKRVKAESDRESQRMRNVHVCPACGKPTDSRSICCSADCTRRMGNHRKDHRISKDKRIDKGITAKALYRRDNGICWICGGQCDLNEYEEHDGKIICGGNYPSVDHIIPVCEGGEDSWENVKLAHRSCNTARYYREKYPSLA